MTFRQVLLSAFYPLLVRVTSLVGKNNSVFENKSRIKPAVSFYDLFANSNAGERVGFNQYKGKKVLLVNTASDCGYTAQYSELQQLQEQFRERLVVVAFPSNDFKEQEKGSDKDIAQFCQLNFSLSFPLMQKSRVIKGNYQHAVYQWLTDSSKNGWNDHQPDWNFSKYLVDEQGVLTYYFGPSVTPLSKVLKAAIC
jgi:glutathione peroxidase